MPLTPSQRSQRARAAALAMHAQHDSRVTSRKGRQAFIASFAEKVDPDGVLAPEERARRADLAYRAHMASLSLRSSTLRSKRATAEQAAS